MTTRYLLFALSLLFFGVLAAGACNSTPDTADWLITFPGGAPPIGTVSVRAEIRTGDCTGPAVFGDDVASGERVGMSPRPLAEGRYYFYAEARNASCASLATGCLAVDVPVDGSISVSLIMAAGAAACPAVECTAGVCGAAPPMDLGVDLGVDMGPPDLGPPDDLGPPVPCTMEGAACGMGATAGLCHGMNCCAGCWDGTACRAGTADLACGDVGTACMNCSPAGTCVAQMCESTPPTVEPRPLALAPRGSFLLSSSGVFASAGSDVSQQRGQPRASSSMGWSFEAYTGPTRFVALAATQFTAYGLTAEGHLYAWGTNSLGLLGSGSGTTTTAQPMPTRVGAESWRTIDGGTQHVCAIHQDGRLACWGDRSDGRIGVGANTGIALAPAFVDAGRTWSGVSAGDRHTCATKSDGSLWCWGYNGGATNRSGQLGVGDSTARDAPARVGADSDWATVAAGNAHTCAIKTSGTLWCWGEAAFWGRLGLGPTDPGPDGDQRTPAQVMIPTVIWASVAAGQFHSCGLAVGGDLYCWGISVRGATGLGTTDTYVPTNVAPGYGVVATGWTHSCGQLISGNVFCWGEAAAGTGTGVDPAGTYLYDPTAVAVAM